MSSLKKSTSRSSKPEHFVCPGSKLDDKILNSKPEPNGVMRVLEFWEQDDYILHMGGT